MDWGVIGHEWAASMLQEHIAAGQVRHAYLFTGPQGIGRRTLALRFAQALNCTNPPQPGGFCGACRACLQIKKMAHPDLSLVQAEKPGGGLLIDQVRSLQHTLSLAPYEAAWRVALILGFEGATANAQNALLKTLEEAPPRVVLLLTASDGESLLPTIVSRCEELRLRPMALENLVSALVEKQKLPRDQSLHLAHLAGGRLGLVNRYLEDDALLQNRLELANDAFTMVECSRRERFTYVEQMPREKEFVLNLLEVWSSVWRDVMLSSAGGAAPLVNLVNAEKIKQVSLHVDFEKASALTAALEHARVQVNANVNPRLLMENVLLDWPRIPPGQVSLS